MASRARVLGPEARCHRVWGGDVGRCSAGPRELCECVLGGDGEPEARRVACSRVSGLRGPLVVTQDAAVAACPRLGLCAGPALNRKRSPRPRSPVAARPGAHGPFGVTPPAGARDTRAWCPPESGAAARPAGPFEAESHAFGGKKKTCGGYWAERGRGEGLAGPGGDIWSFGHNWRPSRRSRGEAKHKAGSRSRRPRFPGAPRFPNDQLAPLGVPGHSFTQQGGSAARSCAFVPGTQDLRALSVRIKPKRNTLLRTGDVRLRACTANPGRRFAVHRTHSRSAYVAVLAGPAPPLPPFSNGSAALRIQGHYIWLQSSFMRLLGC